MPGWLVFDPLLGDGGKAKIVDLLTNDQRVAAVVRFQGGDNAGHTIVVGGKRIAVHAMPSGVVRAQERSLMSVMGRGMVISLPRVFAEIEALKTLGISVTPYNLMISEGAKLTLPYHMAMEKAREDSQGKMGTTCRAISQTYAWHCLYQGLVAGDLRDLDYTRKRIQDPLAYANAIIIHVYGGTPVSEDEVMAELETYQKLLLPFLGNEILYLNQLLAQDLVVLFEGAQSGMLDRDLGIYPNTTASNTWPSAIQAGAGVNPRHLTRIIAVVKAYISRVGIGHLIGEMDEATANLIRERGKEFGTTTGRPRRLGWPDDVVGYYCAMVGQPTELAITKADVLTGIDPLKICFDYLIDGTSVPIFPTTASELNACQGGFQQIAGWEENITGLTNWSDLPENARAYLARIAQPYGCPITMVGTGPDRNQIIIRQTA